MIWKLLTFTFLVIGCAPETPDPRQADVILTANSSFTLEVETSIAWWGSVSGAPLDWTIVAQCSPNRTCIHVLEENTLVHGANAITRVEERDGTRTVTIRLDPNMNPGIRTRVVAHEIGHALDLQHVEDYRDVMFFTAGQLEQCSGEASQAQWEGQYGAVTDWSRLCLP